VRSPQQQVDVREDLERRSMVERDPSPIEGLGPQNILVH
jgi:hypothetical protein